MWQVGDRVYHRFNRDLGPGQVVAADRQQLVVEFLEDGERLTFGAETDALRPLTVSPGATAQLEPESERVGVAEQLDRGRWRLDDGRVVSEDRLWPVPTEGSPVEELARGRVGRVADFENRLDALRLENLRHARGFGSFLGGRIRLYPHQLYAAEAACRSDPVRWLLADGVGLGKTVEACLIMNRLIHTGRATRTLVVAPDALTVQWLGELWRKHHQIFTLLDDKRIAAVAHEQGSDFNPFEVHRRAIVAIESLCDNPRLVEQAVAAGIDLTVVDEAHHLQRQQGHPGNPKYRAIAPIAALGRNLLLLTATPLEDDALGFMRLLQLLRPDELSDDCDLIARLEQRLPLPPCTTATRAADIGGWPPRFAAPVEVDEASWRPLAELERCIRARPAANQVARAHKARLVARALSSAPALQALLKETDQELENALEFAHRADPRLRHLVKMAPVWRDRGEKTLVFVAHRESLELVKRSLESDAHLRVGQFHEELSVKRRDIEVAQLRLPEGPSLLVSTECGGEGRNFEMCHRLVLFDLPWNPTTIEQRIGRLDRIGRSRPTEIVYFSPPTGLAGLVAGLYEEMGLFQHSLGGIDRELRHVADEIEDLAVEPAGRDDHSALSAVLERALAARTRVEEAAYSELHRDPFQQSMASAILARVPAELEELTAEVVLKAAARLGFETEEQSGRATHLITLGPEALVDRLPGVPPGTRFLGTFNRAEAVERETLDFFASGHPLVEGVLRELHEGRHGRAACFSITAEEENFGLLAVYSNEEGIEVDAVDVSGRSRPDLAAKLTAADTRREYIDHTQWTSMPEWKSAVQRLAQALPEGRRPRAAAAFRVHPKK